MQIKKSLFIIAGGALLFTGCATKKYVRNTVDPVSGRVDQVAQQTNKNGQSIDQSRKDIDQTKATLEKDETELSATKERAMSADSRAGDAMKRADQAGQKADTVGRNLDDLKNTVANLDDYKQVGDSTINFKFNSDKLSADAKQSLDRLVANQSQYKRYFIAVEGFTDQTGTTEYNNALSRRRADGVTQYLVAQHNIPVYRIHMIGLGKEKLVDTAKTRAARAKNRRVEVMMYSADPGAMAMNNGTAAPAASASTQQ